MKTHDFRKSVLLAALMLATGPVAHAQLAKDIMKRAKNATTTRTTMAADRAINKGLDKVFEEGENPTQATNANALQNASEKSAAAVTNGNIYYVNLERGSARAEGTLEAPMKDIQKAIDKAARQICQPRRWVERRLQRTKSGQIYHTHTANRSPTGHYRTRLAHD